MKHARVLQWDVERMLSEPERAVEVARFVAATEPDVAVLTNATAGASHRGRSPIDSVAAGILKANGRILHERPSYLCAAPPNEQHALVALTTPGWKKQPLAYPGGRGAYVFRNNDFEVAGFEGADRLWPDASFESPAQARKKQAECILSQLTLEQHASVIAGNFHEIHADRFSARALRRIQPLVQATRSNDDNGFDPHWLEQLCDMASGAALDVYLAEAFEDADPDRRSTTAIGHIAVQTDHILVRNGVAKLERIAAKKLGVGTHDALICTIDRLDEDTK